MIEFQEFTKIARLSRKCECRAPINVGEKHLKFAGLWHGKFDSYRQHMLCRELCMAIRDAHECLYFGALKHDRGEVRELLADRPKNPTFRKMFADILRRERAEASK